MSDDAVSFLAGSRDRLRLLELLRREPATPRDVADDIDVSRRTAQRHLAAFVERDWARRPDGTYHLTTIGELVAETHGDYVATMDCIDEFEPLYRHLPQSVAPSPGLLADATLVAATADHPQAPVDHYVRTLRSLETESVRMLAPVLSRLFHDSHAELVRDGATTELVLPAEKADAARELNPVEFATVLAVPRFSLFSHPDAFEFGLTVTDDRAFLLAYDRDGKLRACVDGDHDAFRNWATSTFDRYREAASPVSPPGPPLP